MMALHHSFPPVRRILFHVTGVMCLFLLFSFSIHQNNIKNIGQELESIALNLFGFISYENNNFMIAEVNKSESYAFIEKHKLRQSGKARFAYIWDMNQQKIIWNLLDNHHVNPETISTNFALFDFDTILSEISPDSSHPWSAKIRESVPLAVGGEPEQYLVVAQTFNLLVDGNPRDYVFIVAASAVDWL